MKTMTSNLKFLLLFVGFAFLIQGCSDDDDGGTIIPEVSASFTQVVNSETGVVDFTNTSQNANSFVWSFGDGNTSTQASPSNTYATSGTFTVTLTASNLTGGTDTAESTVVIDLPVVDPPFDSGLLSNGDFEDPADNSWIVGVDPANPAPTVTDNGNTFYSVNVTSPDPAQPFLVNMSQFVEITQGNTYRLVFDAWSDVDRNIIAGIGLSDGDFANNSEMVAINSTQTTYELVLCANGFGATNARVLFDSNGEAGMVNIDNVALFIEDDTMDCTEVDDGSNDFDGILLDNGGFQEVDENGFVTSWLTGLGPEAAATVVDGTDRFYSVNITEPDPNQPFLVNMSQFVEIVQGNTYRLRFEAWSDVERTIIAGIGLSDGDFSNNSMVVNLTADATVYELDLVATNFGAANARVLFDVNGEAGMVNIDDVSLEVIGSDSGFTGAQNGDFENVDGDGNVTDWIVGVDPNSPAPTVVENGNRFYSVNVTNPDPNQPFLVNMSQILSIEQGNSFVLEFEAWSDVDRNIIAGIGLSDGDFSNDSQMVAITATPTVYSINLSSDTFGATNARILFDSNGEAGMVNIDNVSLTQQ